MRLDKKRNFRDSNFSKTETSLGFYQPSKNMDSTERSWKTAEYVPKLFSKELFQNTPKKFSKNTQELKSYRLYSNFRIKSKLGFFNGHPKEERPQTCREMR